MAAADSTNWFDDRGDRRGEAEPATRRIVWRSRQPRPNQTRDQAAAGGKSLVAPREPSPGRAQMDSAGPADRRSRAQLQGLRQFSVAADLADHDGPGPG